MTTRQQIARLLPLVLLVVLIIAGLRGAVPAPRWTGPLRADGVAIGIALEVVFGVLLARGARREAAARRAAEQRPYAAQDKDIEPPQALRFTLSYVLAACMVAIGVVLIANLHLHFFIKVRPLQLPRQPKSTPTLKPHQGSGAGATLHIPVGPILYTLLIVVLIAAVAVSVWWATRLRRPAAPLVIEDVRHAGAARRGGRGPGGARPGRRRQGGDHRLLRGDGTQPGRTGHRPHRGRHPRRAARPGPSRRGRSAVARRAASPRCSTRRASPPTRSAQASGTPRARRSTSSRRNWRIRRSRAPKEEQAAGPGGGWV